MTDKYLDVNYQIDFQDLLQHVLDVNNEACQNENLYNLYNLKLDKILKFQKLKPGIVQQF